MTNREIAKVFKLTAQLMELHDENPFKIKSYTNAAFKLDKLPVSIETLDKEDLEKIEGIGKGLTQRIMEIRENGMIAELQQMLNLTPAGVIDMLQVKGIGPKKVALLWHELGIESLGELLYACNENRLVELKGFGAKTQTLVQQGIEFMQANVGKLRYVNAEAWTIPWMKWLEDTASCTHIAATGQLRRRCEIVDGVELIVECANAQTLVRQIAAVEGFTEVVLNENAIHGRTPIGLPFTLYIAEETNYARLLFETTAAQAHLELIGDYKPVKFTTESALYEQLNLQYVEPELREGLQEVEWAKNKAIPQLLELQDLKGILHNHSTYSDGTHTLAQMAEYCKELGYEYLGICDHSQTAVYANGLKPERILQQHAEIDQLNSKLAPFRIFKGIESDILADGDLDYEESILKTFDFVVASIHSNLKMDEERATARLIKAIENRYITILGHPTGRLLLGRPGYPINHAKVIDACATNGVVLELNANPYRLDIDWRWIQYALNKNVMISINPDAHSKEGYHDMRFGVLAARKGALTKQMTFNALSRTEIKQWFHNKSLMVSQ